ncbi:MAG: cobalamin-dependent protein [Candidatus Omnitrophica bacterium]|nr:cobalamin-dependent protein [Candidatus Omnitrophota bacterium]
MKVLLINPPIEESILKPVLKNLFYNSPPLGLCYIAAVLKKNKVVVKIIDAAVERLSILKIIKRVEKMNPDVVGLTSTTYSFPFALILAKEIKKYFKDIVIIMGGSHITANPDVLLRFNCFDFGVLGEGEVTMTELIECLKYNGNFEDVPGLAFERKEKLFFSPKRQFIEDLDCLPFPDRDLVPLDLYRPQPNDWNVLPKLSMITTRGCSYGCIFCDKGVFGMKYRSFSPKYIVAEMKMLIDKYGAKDIAFLDSTFTTSIERVKDVILEIKRSKVDVNWTCTVRANVVTYDLLKEMKNAGCWRIRIGVESANNNVLKFIKKGITIEDVRKVSKWADSLGLQPKGFFSIGHLIDTKETINETIEFAKKAYFKDITVQINTPLKGTPQYKICEKYGVLSNKNNVDYSFWQPFFVPNGMTKEELTRLHNKFYRTFYCRFVIIRRHIKAIKGIGDIKKYILSIDLITYLFFNRLYDNKCKQKANR